MKTDRDLWASSAAAWIQRVEDGDPNRDFLLDPVMLSMCRVLPGERLLDIGCGEGRFAREVSRRGAHVVALDPISRLLGAAQGHGGIVQYLCGVGEALPLQSSQFDWVVSYLTLCDIGDYRSALREIARVLRPGGRFVACNVHSVKGPASGWVKAENGQLSHWPLDHYTFESGAVYSWCGIEVVNYHRPLSAYFQAMLSSGLVLEDFQEPIPTPEAIQARPGLADNLRVPNFWVSVWRKADYLPEQI